MLRSISIASVVLVTRILEGIPGIEPVPMWKALITASNMLGQSRWIIPSKAAELANILSVGWAMMGEISLGPEGYVLIIDFLPAKSSVIPFRYERGLRPELLDQRLYEALEQFLRYARHPAPQLQAVKGAGDWNEWFKLAEVVDREYGWFSPPAPGKAQAVYAGLVAHDPRLANLLFNPDLYSAATGPVSGEALKPAAAGGAEPGGKPTPLLPAATIAFPDREPPKQAVAAPPSRVVEMPEKSKWASLTVSPVLSLLAEQALRSLQTSTVANPRASLSASAPPPGYGNVAGGAALPSTPGMRYVLQLFALASETQAKRMAQDLTQVGVPAKVSTMRSEHATFYRVSGGTYSSPSEASAAGDALIALRVAYEYWIRAIPAPATEPPRTAGVVRPAVSRFQVQVFASPDRGKAMTLAERLSKTGLQVRVEQFMLAGKGDYFRVRLTGYQSRNEAVAAAEKLLTQGLIGEYWIVN